VDVGGIEPPHNTVSWYCLTTWLYVQILIVRWDSNPQGVNLSLASSMPALSVCYTQSRWGAWAGIEPSIFRVSLLLGSRYSPDALPLSYLTQDGVGEGIRTLSNRDTTCCAGPLHYAHHGALGQIRTDTIQALILAPPAVGLRAHFYVIANERHEQRRPVFPSCLAPREGFEPPQRASKAHARSCVRGKDGTHGQIRTDTVHVLSVTPPAVGLRVQIGG
jgi:hypothetical protein